MTEESPYEYDLLVIGGGSGGIATAKRAASLYGAKVGGSYVSLLREILELISSCS